MNEYIFGLPPILPEEPKNLIFGSMPGIKSLEGQQYYMNPRNHSLGYNSELCQKRELRFSD